MPPFQPKACVPVPAPTLPSSTAPPLAAFSAATACSGRTCWPRMSLRPPSLVSPTSAFTERTSALPGWSSVQRTTPSITAPTLSVFVRAMGVSMVPSSSTCVEPASLPKALPTNTAPGTLSWNRLPPCGTTAVTPVRTRSPPARVTCPTATPATSVIALSGPGSNTPGASPRSRARGRWNSCAPTAATDRPSIAARIFHRIIRTS